ncbi:hypothetical protein KSP39_PZI012892 [Platanthera zijinensis]|uniref:Uncharacterized protein n=1 Tax=Platanthera zijinensis TaxID=2320716 RepID=A0AAP0BDJ5_9ASPA
MEFLSLLVAASMPVLQLLLIGFLGAFLAYKFSTVFSDNVRRNMNKVNTPFNNRKSGKHFSFFYALTIYIRRWYMPVNIGITFLIGGILGWIAVKILRPARHLEGLIIANCSAGNLGNLMLMIVPAVCDQPGNPFGDQSTCRARGLSYVSTSMAVLAGFAVGAVPWLKSLIIGSRAPLRVIQDSLETLGNGTLPCTTLILGGNLTRGISFSGVMAQLFGVGQEESSVIFLWMYLLSAFALTAWSTVFLYLLS